MEFWKAVYKHMVINYLRTQSDDSRRADGSLSIEREVPVVHVISFLVVQ